jgi:hypothetical protein
MGHLKKVYIELLESIEREYEIELTLGEKVSLKECLISSQKARGRRLTQMFGGAQMSDAKAMWLRQYGISFTDLDNNRFPLDYYEFIRKVRESCILL